jgi:hypothetical protein
MTKEKVGLALFWISVVWMIAWTIIGAVRMPLLHTLTTAELNQTIWAIPGTMSTLHGFAVPLGSIVAGVGIMLYAGAKGSKALVVGIGLFVVFIIGLVAMALNYYSAPVFGVGGSLILLSFIGILWFLANERMALKGESTIVVDLKLVGYIFMITAAWFI